MKSKSDNFNASILILILGFYCKPCLYQIDLELNSLKRYNQIDKEIVISKYQISLENEAMNYIYFINKGNYKIVEFDSFKFDKKLLARLDSKSSPSIIIRTNNKDSLFTYKSLFDSKGVINKKSIKYIKQNLR